MVGGVGELIGESVDESSDERWALNDGFLDCGGVNYGCWVSGDVVVRRICWSCLLDRVARLGAFVALDCFASCRAMVLYYFRHCCVRVFDVGILNIIGYRLHITGDKKSKYLKIIFVPFRICNLTNDYSISFRCNNRINL